MHSTTVPLLDSTPLMIPTSVDCPSPTGCARSASTSGAMLQDIVTLEQVQLTVLVLLVKEEMLQNLLAATSFVSEHIWSYVAGYRESSTQLCNCPCAVRAGRAAPSFVGTDFHCESGTHRTPNKKWYTYNPLWDGKGCYSSSKCCNPSRAPWFFKALPEEATSDIEVRWCQAYAGAVSDRTGIEQLEIYVF